MIKYFRQLNLVGFALSLAVVIGCGTQPGDTPLVPDPMGWTGTVKIVGYLYIDEVIIEIDSLGVIIDGVDLGYEDNPYQAELSERNTHSVETYYETDSLTYIFPARNVTVEHDKVREIRAQMTRSDRGWLLLDATAAGQAVDSVIIRLDGIERGTHSVPVAFAGEVGSHKLVLFASTDEDLWEQWLSNVKIVSGDTTDIPTIILEQVGVEVGEHAPEIDSYDLENQYRYLSDHWGDVILLYFFKHT